MNWSTRLIRLPDVLQLTGLSRSSVYRLEKEGRFVSRVRLGERATAWRFEEVKAWIEARPLAEAVPLSVGRGENVSHDPVRS
jgi:prophage regulatory protein